MEGNLIGAKIFKKLTEQRDALLACARKLLGLILQLNTAFRRHAGAGPWTPPNSIEFIAIYQQQTHVRIPLEGSS